jgi:hypothetical protein
MCETNKVTEWGNEDKKEIISVEFSSETTLVTTRVTYAIKVVVIWLMCCVPVIGFICSYIFCT